MNPQEWRRATVISVLSGDTIVVKYTGEMHSFGVIKIAYAQAPNLTFFSHTGTEEPFGIESWKHLKSLLKLKRVLVAFPPVQTPTEKIKVPILGDLPYIVTEVRIAHDGEDILTNLLTNGCAKTDENDPHYSLCMKARSISCGLWSSSKRQEVVPADVKDLYQNVTEFEAYVLDFDTTCIFRLFVPDQVVIVEVELSGVYIPSAIREVRAEMARFLAETLLADPVRVRAQQINKKNNLVGCISVNGQDLSRILLQKGYAAINDITSFVRSDRPTITSIELRAKRRGIGIWKAIQWYVPELPPEFEAKVVEIESSNSILVRRDEESTDVRLKWALVERPQFAIDVEAEPGGYDAYEMLRVRLVGQRVHVEMNDSDCGFNYAIVFHNGVNINELLVREGLGRYSPSGVLKTPRCAKLLEIASKEAKVIEKPLNPVRNAPAEYVQEMSHNLKGQTLDGIISRVCSPLYYMIDIPSEHYRILFCLQGIDAPSPEDTITEDAIEWLRAAYLGRPVTLRVAGADLSTGSVSGTFHLKGTREDVRHELLRQGFATVLSDNSLNAIMESARSKKVGLHARGAKKPFPVPPQMSAVATFNITSVIDPVTVSVHTRSNSSSFMTIKWDTLDQIAQPKRGNFVVLVRNNFAYRAHVRRLEGAYVIVLLIDFGFTVRCFADELRRANDSVMSQPASGMRMRLAFLEPFEENQEMVAKYLFNILGNRAVLHGYVLSTISIPEVVLLTHESLDSMSVQYLMLKDGAAKLKREPAMPENLRDLYEKLVEAEKTGRSLELGFFGRRD